MKAARPAPKRPAAGRKRKRTVVRKKAVRKLAMRTGWVALLAACALVLAGPFTYDTETHQVRLSLRTAGAGRNRAQQGP